MKGGVHRIPEAIVDLTFVSTSSTGTRRNKEKLETQDNAEQLKKST